MIPSSVKLRTHASREALQAVSKLWMYLKAGTSVYFPTPLGGVQCSFEHKLPRRRGSRGQRESTEPEIGVAGREQARPRFPAFLAGSGRSSPNQRSSRQGMLARRRADAVGVYRSSSFWLRAGSSYVALRITGKCRSARCAIEPVSRGCGQGTSRERRTTRPHPPTTEIASSGGDARSRRADLEPWGSWRGLLPYFPPPGQTERARSHRGWDLRTDREHRIMLRATPS